ncbi:hypothetical protein KIH74_10720 [Kineosporia sp. J2-2]|uniref:Biopolymer transporter Tol n=1 Tax=Kineosporia corallincola TaxID=2835133 RepID=A0ABS5TG89_9ACTN|nr:hypothetical protein [Kineosporia corallincola]MBT0769394.1 hypothetical protein [Kineosporia corallincola]
MPDRTPDGHHVVIDGRKWRATDPDLPPEVSEVLRHELMDARRAVGRALKSADPGAERDARDRVQRAKVALGERGTPWWEQSAGARRERWEPLYRELTGSRG